MNNPLSSPNCPGYDAAMLKKVTIDSQAVDPLSNEYVKAALVSPAPPEEEKKPPVAENKEKKKEPTAAEKKAIVNTLVSKEAAATSAKLESLNNIPGLDLYRINMAGGVYNETVRYVDKKLPDSSKVRRLTMAQENLHKSMVDSQYDR